LPHYFLRMIFSENRYPLFGIMLSAHPAIAVSRTECLIVAWLRIQ